MKSLHEHIAALAKKRPEKTALLTCDENGKIIEEISYGELVQRVEAAAAYLAGLGLKKSDRVALSFRNSAELLTLSWAAWSTGIVTVPMDVKRDTGEQYEYKIKLNGAKTLIAQSGVLKNIEQKYLKKFKVVEFGDLAVSGDVEWQEGVSHQALALFTSGTTGHPKGAKLSLENLLVNAEGIREWLKITEADTFLVNLPLHHINSTTFCLATLLAGGTIAIPPQYSNSHFWQQVASTGATITSIVQSVVFDQLNREQEYAAVEKDIKLNRIQIGSAPVIAQTVQEFMGKFGIALYQGYGHTETALRVTGVPMGLPKKLYERLVEENSIGVPMSWADIKVMGEKGEILGEGGEGELVVKGPAVMEGYVGEEPAFQNGYFLTGDIGRFTMIEGQRFFYLTGRKKELIIKGGINISPVAVENHLKKISSDIDQVYAVSVVDERYGEEIGVAVVWKQGVDVVSAKRRLKCELLFGTPFISAYETPKYLTSLTLEELPMTSTGKAQRTVLKDKLPYERFESIYGLIKTPQYRFTALHRYSRWVPASYKLYNQCWEPLTMERVVYEKSVPKQLIILAAKPDDSLAGQIALIRTNLSDEALLDTTYDQLLEPEIADPQGKKIVCISICSADYRPKPIPSVARTPSVDEVRAYIEGGSDPVMRFHQKPKGGQEKGAALVGVIPAGRSEDKSSLGYNMLLKYPPLTKAILISEDAPVSNQLIEVVMLIAQDAGITDVYAYSRPGGLAAHMSKKA